MSRFPDGARVCFIGDSITAQNKHFPRIMDYYNTHFPDADISFYNCGVSGANVPFQLAYFDKNVLPFRPTHAVLAIGVNDSGRDLLDEPKSMARYEALYKAYGEFQEHYAALCDKILSHGITLTLCTPPPYAEYQVCDTPSYAGGFSLIAGYADFVRQFAKARNLPLCDYHAYLTKVMQGEDLYETDRVHPTVYGQYHIAKCFLAYQGLAIGEFTPLPDGLNEYLAAVDKRLSIYATELMLVKDRSASPEALVGQIEQYLAEKAYIGTGYDEYFKMLGEMYLLDKPKEAEIEKEILRLTEAVKQHTIKK